MTDVIPIVYCVAPVHNRLETTKHFLEYINEQDYPAVRVIIVNDGSSDGTQEYLAQASRPNLTVLEGDGNLWWGGAMHLGMSYVMGIAQASDYLLMMNDDVRIGRNYISALVKESVSNAKVVVGSSQYDDRSGSRLSSGWHVDYWSLCLTDWKDQKASLDALPGRGVLFPMHAVFRVGNVNARLFPHYFGDIEYTARVSESGWKLLVSKEATVFTSSSSERDVKFREMGIFARYFSFKSRRNLIHKFLFFSVRGPLLLRIFVIPRFPLALIAKYIR